MCHEKMIQISALEIQFQTIPYFLIVLLFLVAELSPEASESMLLSFVLGISMTGLDVTTLRLLPLGIADFFSFFNSH